MDIACWKHASKQSTPAPFNWRQSLTKYPSLDPPPFMMEHEYRPLWTSRTSSPGRNWVPRYTAYTWWISLSSEAQRKTLSPPLGYGDGSQTWGWWIAATTPGGALSILPESSRFAMSLVPTWTRMRDTWLMFTSLNLMQPASCINVSPR